jgi:hypothetical protein
MNFTRLWRAYLGGMQLQFVPDRVWVHVLMGAYRPETPAHYRVIATVPRQYHASGARGSSLP